MGVVKEKTRVSIRTDKKLKEEAAKVLDEMQLDMSTAFNLFLDQVVKQQKIPFEITNQTVEEKEWEKIREEIAEGFEDVKAGRIESVESYYGRMKKEYESLKAESKNSHEGL